ncbi:3-keto-disaccharide hydrolase [Urbifossiella limnaea]|uniref:3-keto-alpha-glucoside-1,2-lyase/3-keto-2-hydroxy-glucal hydratase domain-containing protein n=1 Tax=Urbifossiella limnaea TaxID=2528023 RepID=A0A517XYM3_9BACT|nr:DUF1080 domain-containing protein [Urbifossiella limnaea]QDU22573.1 hypothetical protein ETAA1_45560 [Urbifossiella limnaea]
MRLAACCLVAAVLGWTPGADAPGSDAPAPAGWIDLMKPEAWKKVDPGWIVTDRVSLDPEKATKLKAEKAAGGTIWVNGDKGRIADLYTRASFGDCDVHVEFMVAKNSNSGVKLQGVYEIQFIDRTPPKEPTGDSMGGIYPRADTTPNYHHIDKGIAPKANAGRPAGEWNTLDLTWRAPRFGADGKKSANAAVVRAVLNGQVIHENQELRTPTGNNYPKAETPTGPLMLQADHGPVAFRAVRIRPTK